MSVLVETPGIGEIIIPAADIPWKLSEKLVSLMVWMREVSLVSIKSMNFAPFLAYDIQTNGEKISKIKVVISEGKNRELRRFFGYFGLDVMDLKRVEYGGVSLNNLPTGKTRFLTKDEYKNLRIFLNEEDDRLS